LSRSDEVVEWAAIIGVSITAHGDRHHDGLYRLPELARSML
jgi:hypothetical protein